MDHRIQKIVNRPYCVGNRYFETEQEAETYCKAIDHVEKHMYSDTFQAGDDFTGTLFQIRSAEDLKFLSLYLDKDLQPDAKFIMNRKLPPDERRRVFWDYEVCDITLEELESCLAGMNMRKESIVNQIETLSRIINSSRTEVV